MQAFAGRRILFVVENLPSPFDRRVWQEATTLRDHGARVSIVCPIGRGYESRYEMVEGIAIYRHSLLTEGDGPLGYALEYASALFWESVLVFKCLLHRGFDVIHICNPPDLLFLVALPYKLIGKRVLFDHHDINPELFLAKFGKRNTLYHLMLLLERWTFKAADTVISTNESYRKIALQRGRKNPRDVYVVRSGPSLERMRTQPPDERWKCGRRFLVGYVGVIGKQEGLQYLVDACDVIVNQRRRSDIHFACVGGGTELDSIIHYVRQKQLEEYFTFTGRVPDETLLSVLNTADICVNPDEYNEMNDKSTMNKVMEYMALGKPIVQFDLTEGRFSAQDASLYARPNDSDDLAAKVLDLVDDPERREKMGAFGLERVRTTLAWTHEKGSLIRAYKSVFGLARAGR